MEIPVEMGVQIHDRFIHNSIFPSIQIGSYKMATGELIPREYIYWGLKLTSYIKNGWSYTSTPHMIICHGQLHLTFYSLLSLIKKFRVMNPDTPDHSLIHFKFWDNQCAFRRNESTTDYISCILRILEE
jgi:hypothetical protein